MFFPQNASLFLTNPNDWKVLSNPSRFQTGISFYTMVDEIQVCQVFHNTPKKNWLYREKVVVVRLVPSHILRHCFTRHFLVDIYINVKKKIKSRTGNCNVLFLRLIMLYTFWDNTLLLKKKQYKIFTRIHHTTNLYISRTFH